MLSEGGYRRGIEGGYRGGIEGGRGGSHAAVSSSKSNDEMVFEYSPKISN